MAHQHTQQPITTGASILGLKFKGGVIIAGDTMVAYGSSLRFDGCQRLHRVGEKTIVGAAGEFSDYQYLQELLDDTDLEDWMNQDGYRWGPKAVASYLGRVMYNRRSKNNPLWNQLLIGGVDEEGVPQLNYVDLQGTCFAEDFVATGFGLHLALPILRKEYKPDLTEAQAKKIMERCLELCFYRDCKASCNIQMAIATAEGTRIEQPYRLNTFWTHKEWTKTSAELELAGDSW